MQFVASGNAELGFVALSQLQIPGKSVSGSYWLVPTSLCAPIPQGAALLAHGEQSPAARAFLEYLKTDEAKTVIRSFGYELETSGSPGADGSKKVKQ
jgi:molybdate transport system substrate-binding protein